EHHLTLAGLGSLAEVFDRGANRRTHHFFARFVNGHVGDRLANLFQVAGGLGKEDRKSTRLNSSHVAISYAVFCLKKKKKRRLAKNIEYKKNSFQKLIYV